jgi:hypothetical protein
MFNAEFYEQVKTVNYLRLRYPDVLFTISAGGMRTSIGTAKKMKTAGYSKGTPDIMIFEPRGKYHGLFIEMKTAKTAYSLPGRASIEQKSWADKLNKRGYLAVFAFGSDSAIKEIESYMNQGKSGVQI